MSTERHGERENRESFKVAKDKEIFEATIDANRLKVEEEKNKKQSKKEARLKMKEEEEKKKK